MEYLHPKLEYCLHKRDVTRHMIGLQPLHSEMQSAPSQRLIRCHTTVPTNECLCSVIFYFKQYLLQPFISTAPVTLNVTVCRPGPCLIYQALYQCAPHPFHKPIGADWAFWEGLKRHAQGVSGSGCRWLWSDRQGNNEEHANMLF